MFKRLALLVSVFLSLQLASLSACPTISTVVDFNCDQKGQLVFVGDSFVKGRGDSRNGDVGGYVRRVKNQFPDFKVINYGQPGYTTSQLYRQLKEAFFRKSKEVRKFRGADFVMVDIGRNGYFKDMSPSLVARDIKRIVGLLRKELKKGRGGVAPYIVVATQAPTNRSYQAGYINDINDSLFSINSSKFPVLVRFDELPNSILSSDGLHPSSKGYKVMSDLIVELLAGVIAEKELAQRPDSDSDGIFDRFEASHFGTDKTLIDTDGDGFTDGEEVFLLETDPLVANEMNFTYDVVYVQ